MRKAFSVEPALRDGEIDTIRHEILSGRGLFVLTGGDLLGSVREAVAVAGRTADLRTVYLDSSYRHGRIGCEARRPRVAEIPASDPDAEDADPSPAFLARPAEELAILPEAGWDELLAPGRVVVILSVISRLGETYARLLLEEAYRRTARGGAEVPPFVLDRPSQRARGTPWITDPAAIAHAGSDEDALRMWSGFVRGTEHAVYASPSVFARASRELRAAYAARTIGRAWRDGLARLDAGFDTDCEDGVAFAGDGTRAGLARRYVPAEDGPAGEPRVDLFELHEEGSCHGISLVGGTYSDADLRRLALLVARGGLVLVESGEHGLDEVSLRTMQDPLARLDPDAGTLLPRAPRIRRRIAGRTDAAVLGLTQAGHFQALAFRLLDAAPDIRRNRRDFMLSFPAFAGALLDPGVRARVDAGARTIPLVAGLLRVEEAVARRLVGLDRIGRIDVASPDGRERSAFGALVGAIGHDRLPEAGDGPGWNALLLCVARLQSLLRASRVRDIDPRVAADLLVGMPGGTWPERFATLDRDGLDDAGDAGDMVIGLGAWLVDLTGEEDLRGTAFALIAGHNSLTRVLAASHRWHADRRFRNSSDELPPETTWPVPFDPIALGEGWEARALDSVQALLDEGGEGPDGDGLAGLTHCVGGYGPACQAGESLILSLRHRGFDGQTRRVSTVELRPGPGGWSIGGATYALAQHKAALNAAVPAEAASRLDALRGRLARGEVPVRREALEPREPQEPQERARVWRAPLLHEAWRRILPPAYARLELQDLAQRVLGVRRHGAGARSGRRRTSEPELARAYTPR